MCVGGHCEEEGAIGSLGLELRRVWRVVEIYGGEEVCVGGWGVIVRKRGL